MFGFERLEVWQKAVEYADTIYVATRAFPDDERFGLTRQLRDASISISSNIAEESARSSTIDFKRFIEIAYGSLLETVSQLTVAERQGFIGVQAYQSIYAQAENLARMLSGLRQNLSNRSKLKVTDSDSQDRQP
jgi:four helix bundle protein